MKIEQIDSTQFSAVTANAGTVICPDNAVEIVLLEEGTLRLRGIDDQIIECDDDTLFVRLGRAVMLDLSQSFKLTRITFPPFFTLPVLPYSKVSSAELRDVGTAETKDVLTPWAYHALGRIKRITKFENRKATLQELFNAKACSSQALMVVRAIREFHEQKGFLSLKQIRISQNVSERTFHRHFKAFTGVHPVFFERNHRYLNALEQLKSPCAKDYASIAMENGYYDQNHFIKEIKHFTGLCPSVIAASVFFRQGVRAGENLL